MDIEKSVSSSSSSNAHDIDFVMSRQESKLSRQSSMNSKRSRMSSFDKPKRSLSQSLCRHSDSKREAKATNTVFDSRALYSELPVEERRNMEVREDGRYVMKGVEDELFAPPVARKDMVTTFEWMIKKTSPDQDCFGSRPLQKDGSTGPLVWISKGEFLSMSEHLAEGFRERIDELCPSRTFSDMGYYPEIKAEEEKLRISTIRMLGISMRNRLEFCLMEFVAQMLGIILVPLYSTLGASAMGSIIEETNMDTIIVDPPTLTILLKTWSGVDTIKPKKIMLTHSEFDAVWWEYYQMEGLVTQVEALGIQVLYLKEFKACSPLDKKLRHKWSGSDVWSISYTSGTTGEPKGAMLSMHAINTIAYDVLNAYNTDTGMFSTREGANPTYFSYLPMAHVLDRSCLTSQLLMGSRAAFHSGDLETLFSELKEAGTTILITVPRVIEKLRMRVMAGMEEKSLPVKFLFRRALSGKIAKQNATGSATHTLWDAIIMNKIKDMVVGPQLQTIVCGGAPLSSEIRCDVQAMLGVKIVIGYGLTESCGAAFCQHSQDTSNSIGWVMKSSEAKFIDVPDLEYFAKDGCGELLIRGHSLFSGYFRKPEKTEESFTEDGWFRTGDVARFNDDDGAAIIDRAKNCFKLSQGEYIAPEKIENILKVANGVDQIIVTGDTSQSYCISIVSIAEASIEKSGKSANEFLKKKSNLDQIAQHINKKAADSELFGFEIPKNFIFVGRSLTPDDGFHTPTLKVKRIPFDKKFTKLIKHVYETETNIAIDIDEFLVTEGGDFVLL
eukprot:GHVH01011527.1.p1 GENE.GHVH01011527.1~~GHVH01011527.1.p1  ORF type:complete len:783 (-),score=126.96 GHVH01011527.1:57-2405(-)